MADLDVIAPAGSVRLLALLRRVKCKLVGHFVDYEDPRTPGGGYSRPGWQWCARCLRFNRPARGPLRLEHARVLRSAGWTDAEITQSGWSWQHPDEVLRYLRAVRALPLQAPEVVHAFEDGYLAGYCAGRFPRRAWPIVEGVRRWLWASLLALGVIGALWWLGLYAV